MPSIHGFQQFREAMALGLSQVFEDDLKQHPKSYSAFLKESTAKEWFETDWSVSGLGSMPEKGIGEAVSTDKIFKGPTKQYDLTPYALGVTIEYEAMRWELYGIFESLPRELARSAVERYNLVGHSVLNNSFLAPNSKYQTHQSENLVSTTHTRLDGGTWTNRSATDVGLSYLGIQEALIDFAKLVNERGRFGQLTPTKLITSVEQEWIARTILQSQYRVGNANEEVNLLKGMFDLYVSPYLTNPTWWWLQSSKDSIRMKMRIGDRPKMEKDNDIRTKNILMHVYTSFGLAIFDSKGLWGSQGA